ncbi:MAG: hypothetical protein IT458_16925 [Planctomycetes bacterium]|nr:hypothetical protein [Planctomycetota bacterium]
MVGRLGLLLLAASSGAGAWFLAVAPVDPLPPRHGEDLLRRDADHVVTITEARPLQLHYVFGAVRWTLTVELPANGELDVVFRRNQPPAGHGRFALLRLSSVAEGPPWRTREEALFADDLRGGVKVAPGVPATVTLEMRGHVVQANVAGRTLPAFRAFDVQGGQALVVRGGTAVVRSVRMERLPEPADPLPWLPAALMSLGLLAGIAFTIRPAGLRVVVLLLPLAGGWLAGRVLFAHLVGDWRPDGQSVLFGSLCAVPLAASLLAGRARVAWAVVGTLLGASLLESAARGVREGLAPLQDPRLDLYFGAASRTAPFDALARVVQSRHAVHTLAPLGERVWFLGGEAVWEAGPDLGRHLALQVAGELSQGTRKVEAVVVSHPFAHALQQVLVVGRFYADFAPKVVVFALGPWDGVADEPVSARAAHAALRHGPPPHGWPLLLELWRATRRGTQRLTPPADLPATLDELLALCRRLGAPLVLADPPDADPDLRTALTTWARAHEIPVAPLPADGSPPRALAEQIRKRL